MVNKIKWFLRNAVTPLSVLVPLALLTSACFVQGAVDTLAAAQGFITQAQVNHQAECAANPSKQFPCVDINLAVAAQNAAVSALEAYCQLPVAPDPATLKALGTKTCNANPQAKDVLVSALANLSKVLTQYKQISGGKP